MTNGKVIRVKNIADTLKGFGLTDISETIEDLRVVISDRSIELADLVGLEVERKFDISEEGNYGFAKDPRTNQRYVIWSDKGIADSGEYLVPIQTYEDWQEEIKWGRAMSTRKAFKKRK